MLGNIFAMFLKAMSILNKMTLLKWLYLDFQSFESKISKHSKKFRIFQFFTKWIFILFTLNDHNENTIWDKTLLKVACESWDQVLVDSHFKRSNRLKNGPKTCKELPSSFLWDTLYIYIYILGYSVLFPLIFKIRIF